MKKTLKQKIVLGLLGVTSATTIVGATLFTVGSINNQNLLKDYRNSDEYKNIVAQELSEAEQKYESGEITLESVEEYYNTVNEIYALEHAEKTIGTSEKFKAEYASNQKIRSAGIATLGAGAVLFTAYAVLSIEKTYKELNNVENKSKEKE